MLSSRRADGRWDVGRRGFGGLKGLWEMKLEVGGRRRRSRETTNSFHHNRCWCWLECIYHGFLLGGRHFVVDICIYFTILYHNSQCIRATIFFHIFKPCILWHSL